MKKQAVPKISILILLFVGMSIRHTNVLATNFAGNEAYYQKLCATSAGYKAHKKECQAYEAYLKDARKAANDSVKAIKDQIARTKGDIQKLLALIKENEKLISKKEAEISYTQKSIIKTQLEMKEIEKEIGERIAAMQDISSENLLIDFIMGANNLQELIVRLDGIHTITKSNFDLVDELDAAKEKLNNQKESLISDKKNLATARQNNLIMVSTLRKNEAILFDRMQAEQMRQNKINNKLNGINVGNVRPSTSSGRPLDHGVVTAGAWSYPASFGGGWHPGIDIGVNRWTPVIASANGIVLGTFTSCTAEGNFACGYGRWVVVAYNIQGETYTMIYGHLKDFNTTTGKQVSKGQIIAYSGSAGASTGPHLHVEVFHHPGQSIKSVVNKYKASGDYYFGLGYTSISGSGVSRLKPHQYFNLSVGQSF
jgi:murein DD-endopeptidase MepM/ murein hydrolase activator NlpD